MASIYRWRRSKVQNPWPVEKTMVTILKTKSKWFVNEWPYPK